MDEYTLRRRVEFSDTDMAGIVHFAEFFRYMESAEHALFRALGHSIRTRIDGVDYGWPRAHAACDHHAPLRFEEECDVRVLVRAVRRRSLDLGFLLTRPDPGGATAIATGRLVTVCTRKSREGTMEAVPIPEPIRSRLEPAAAATLEAAGLADADPPGTQDGSGDRIRSDASEG